MITDTDCGPGKVLVNGMCVPATPEEKLSARQPKLPGRSDIEYYRQYQQNLPGYQTPGQGTYTGMGTGAFHPHYGVPGKYQGASVLSTPLISEYSGPTPTGRPGSVGGLPPFEISGPAAGQSGYDSIGVMRGHRVRETPKRIDAPFSMGDPYSQGGSLWNVGRMMENRVDPYGGVDPTLLYDLRSREAGGALVPPGYTAGPGRTTPSEGTISMPDLLKAASIPEGSPSGQFYGDGIPEGRGGSPVGAPAAGAPGMGGGGLFNLGGLLSGGAPAAGASSGGGLFGGIGGAPGMGGAPSRGGKGAGGTKKSGKGSAGGAKKGGGGTGKGSGSASTIPIP